MMTPGGSSLMSGGGGAPPPPMPGYPVVLLDGHAPKPGATLGSLAVRTLGGVPSSDPALASFPLPYSKKMPYPPRMAIFPSPCGSQANPMRGAGLNKCPFWQPGSEVPAIVAAGNAVKMEPGTKLVPPGPPHCTKTLKREQETSLAPPAPPHCTKP